MQPTVSSRAPTRFEILAALPFLPLALRRLARQAWNILGYPSVQHKGAKKISMARPIAAVCAQSVAGVTARPMETDQPVSAALTASRAQGDRVSMIGNENPALRIGNLA